MAWSPDGKTVYAAASNGSAVTELLALDRDDGSSHSLAKGSFYGFDVSPDGSQLVYSRAPEVTPEGICGDQFDLYVTKLDGSSAERITNDGVSAFPVWGPAAIAFSHFPSTGDQFDCSAPGIRTIDPDGSNPKTVIDRSPDSINLLGFYGLQPLGWADDSHLLIGLRGESGTEGAVLDIGSKKIRRLNERSPTRSRATGATRSAAAARTRSCSRSCASRTATGSSCARTSAARTGTAS